MVCGYRHAKRSEGQPIMYTTHRHLGSPGLPFVPLAHSSDVKSVATTVTSGTNTVIGALVYQGMPSDLRSMPEQSHYLPGALLPPVTTRRSIESQTGVPTFNSTEKTLKFTIYYYILILQQKRCDI